MLWDRWQKGISLFQLASTLWSTKRRFQFIILAAVSFDTFQASPLCKANTNTNTPTPKNMNGPHKTTFSLEKNYDNTHILTLWLDDLTVQFL